MYGHVGRSSFLNAGRSSSAFFVGHPVGICCCLSCPATVQCENQRHFHRDSPPRVPQLVHASLPPPLRPSSASHLRRPRRRGTHGRPHPKPPHRPHRRPPPRQALERRPLHRPLRLRTLPPPAHRRQSPRLSRLPRPSAHGALPQRRRHPPHHHRDSNLPPPPPPTPARHPRRLVSLRHLHLRLPRTRPLRRGLRRRPPHHPSLGNSNPA